MGGDVPVILLDTHAWVRWLHPEISRKLPDRLRTWLEAADAPLAVSVISALEVAQLVKKGILELPLPMPEWFEGLQRLVFERLGYDERLTYCVRPPGTDRRALPDRLGGDQRPPGHRHRRPPRPGPPTGATPFRPHP